MNQLVVRPKTLPQLIVIAISAVTGSFLVFSKPTMAATIGVNWTSPTAGDLNGIAVTFSAEDMTDIIIYSSPLSDSDFAAAPLSSSQEVVLYGLSSGDWTATFSSPLSDLLLYARCWRGFGAGVNPVNYTFDQPFTILSGLAGATVTGNTLSVSDSGCHNGVIQFTSPVSSLSVTSNSNATEEQELTFGIDQEDVPFQPVPEPLTIFGLATALGLGALLNKKNLRRQKNKQNN